MRWLGRLLVVALLALLAGALGLLGWQGYAYWQSAVASGENGVAQSSHLTYLPPGERGALRFTLPAGVESLRVLSNANLHRQAGPFSDPVQYRLHLEVLDGAGKQVDEWRYHHRTRLLHYRDEASGDLVKRLFYYDEALDPAAGQEMVIDLPARSRARELRIRVEGLDTTVADVGLRVYFRQLSATADSQDLLRLSREDQKQLARHQVREWALLDEPLQARLLKHQWRPLGPAGVEGEDYRQRRVYSRDREQLEPEELVQGPSGQLLRADQRLLLPVAQPGALRLHLRFWSGQAELAATQPAPLLKVRWHAADGSRSELLAGALSAAEAGGWRWQAELIPGWLEIGLADRAPGELRWLVQRESGKATADSLQPAGVFSVLRGYSLTPGEQLRYGLPTGELGTVPLRLDIRALYPAGDSVLPPDQRQAAGDLLARVPDATQVRVRYRLWGPKDKLLREGILEGSSGPDPFDSVRGPLAELRPGERLQWFFHFRPPAERLELIAEEPVVVSAFTRPPGMKLQREAGSAESRLQSWADRQAQEPEGAETLPPWFMLLPQEAATLDQRGRRLLLATQPRLPEVGPEVQEGQYQWQAYAPQGNGVAVELLTPYQLRARRPEILSNLYTRLRPGVEQQVELQAPPTLPWIRPELVFLWQQDRAFPYRLWIDGQAVQQGWLAGRHGRLHLPPLRPGRHRVLLDAEAPVQWWLNYRWPNSFDAGRLRRTVYQLTPGRQRFGPIEHSGEARYIGLRFYTQSGREAPLRVRIRLRGGASRGIGPWKSWTFGEQELKIGPDSGFSWPVLQQNRHLAPAQRAGVLLGDDLASGRYYLEIEQLEGPPGYVSVSSLTPGQVQSQTIRKQHAP